MAPELIAAAERIFRAGWDARNDRGVSYSTVAEAWQEWQRSQPGYRPSTSPAMRPAPDVKPAWGASSDHGPEPLPPFDYGASPLDFGSGFSSPDPTPDTSWSSPDSFSGGGGGDFGGAGATGTDY